MTPKEFQVHMNIRTYRTALRMLQARYDAGDTDVYRTGVPTPEFPQGKLLMIRVTVEED